MAGHGSPPTFPSTFRRPGSRRPAATQPDRVVTISSQLSGEVLEARNGGLTTMMKNYYNVSRGKQPDTRLVSKFAVLSVVLACHDLNVRNGGGLEGVKAQQLFDLIQITKLTDTNLRLCREALRGEGQVFTGLMARQFIATASGIWRQHGAMPDHVTKFEQLLERIVDSAGAISVFEALRAAMKAFEPAS